MPWFPGPDRESAPKRADAALLVHPPDLAGAVGVAEPVALVAVNPSASGGDVLPPRPPRSPPR
jgi:hypothetical protein